jgi:hypothetical protein
MEVFMRLFRLSRFSLAILIVATLVVAWSLAAGAGVSAATSLTVTKKIDVVDGHCNASDCSLRDAIIASNAAVGTDTIVLGTGIYKLTIAGANEDNSMTGDLDIKHDVVIQGQGSGKTIIDATGLGDRVFDVYPIMFVGSLVRFSGLTIQGGDAGTAFGGAIAADSSGPGPGTIQLDDVVITGNHAFNGGAIDNRGTMTIANSVISGNRAASGPFGGGITNVGTLTISNTTITGNSADISGGGIYNIAGNLTLNAVTMDVNSSMQGGAISAGGGTINITNSTISGNAASNDGGGIYAGAAPQSISLTNVTLADNTATTGSQISFDGHGSFNLKDTIISGVGGHNCGGTVHSQGHNISNDGTCSLTGSGDLPNKDPKLGPLADNRGPTKTRALASDSPAKDAASNDCPPPNSDQRGVSRPQGPSCDIGAFEIKAAISYLWGDWNCDGAINGLDALFDLLFAAHLAVPTVPNCPAVGDTIQPINLTPKVWGNGNCDGATDETDALATLEYYAAVHVPPPTGDCPAYGATIQVPS